MEGDTASLTLGEEVAVGLKDADIVEVFEVVEIPYRLQEGESVENRIAYDSREKMLHCSKVLEGSELTFLPIYQEFLIEVASRALCVHKMQIRLLGTP